MSNNKITKFPKHIIDFYNGGSFDLGKKNVFGNSDYINFGYWEEQLPPDNTQITKQIRLRASENLYRKILNLVNAGRNDIILEIGTGRGRGAKLIHDEFVPNKYIGIDFSISQVKHALKYTKKYKNMNIIQADAKHIPIDAKTFNIVISVEVFQHINELQKVFKEVYRVLQHDGKFAFCSFFPTHQKYIDELSNMLPLVKLKLDYLHPVEIIEDKLNTAGFQNIQTIAIGKNVWKQYLRYSKEQGEVWPQVQLDAYERGLLDYYIFTAQKA